MAELFVKQAQEYADNRPTYPPDLFRFIASKTPKHHVVWDVGTGSGQAMIPLAEIYKSAIGTDTSEKQLEHAPKLANVRYLKTPPETTTEYLQENVAHESTVDLVTIAQAIHWFDLPKFYSQVRWILKKPDGVIAAWCYTTPEVNAAVDGVFQHFYNVCSGPFWEEQRKLVDDKYMSIEFPFEAVEGVEGTGPVEFTAEKAMSLEKYLSYIRSWSAYNTAKERGVELLGEDVVANFKAAWDEDGGGVKIVRFPVYLRIGKAGQCA
ncbi:hypothetical protein V2J09_015999 [Rumex salicifolius]